MSTRSPRTKALKPVKMEHRLKHMHKHVLAAEGCVPHDKQGECERGNLWGAQGVSPTFCLRFFILPSIQSQNMECADVWLALIILRATCRPGENTPVYYPSNVLKFGELSNGQ